LRVKIAEFGIGRWREQIDIFFLDMSGILPIGAINESFSKVCPGSAAVVAVASGDEEAVWN
jgi:hypothetical protein